MDVVIIIATGVAAVAASLGVLLPTFTRIVLRPALTRESASLVRTIEDKVATALAPPSHRDKIAVFLATTTRVFYYFESQTVGDLSGLLLREPEVQALKTRQAGKTKDSLIGKIPFLTGERGLEEEESIEATYAVPIHDAARYHELERRLLTDGRVELGLEDVPEDPSLDDLEATLESLKQKSARQQVEKIEAFKRELLADRLRQRALEKIDELRTVSGKLILMKGPFAVARIDGGWQLVYNHPLNQHLRDSEKRVTITAVCHEHLIRDQGRAAFSGGGRQLTMTILGRTASCDENGAIELRVLPIVIY